MNYKYHNLGCEWINHPGEAEDYKGRITKLVKEYFIDVSPRFIALARDFECVNDANKPAEDYVDILIRIKQVYVTGRID